MSKIHAASAGIAKPSYEPQNRYMESPTSRRGSLLARGWIVRAAVVISILLVLGMTALLWQRWISIREPTTAILVQGDPSLSGARITVESEDEPSEPKVEVTLGQEKRSQAIFRHPGHYRVSVSFPNEKESFTQTVTVYRLHGAVLELPTTLTILGQPGDKVTIANSEGSARQTFSFESSKSRATTLIWPGKYTLLRTHGAAPQPEEQFTIEPHTPRTIELPKIE